MTYLLIAIPLALAAGALWGYAAGAEATERRYRTATRFFSELEIEERRQSRINTYPGFGPAPSEYIKSEKARYDKNPQAYEKDLCAKIDEDELIRRWKRGF